MPVIDLKRPARIVDGLVQQTYVFFNEETGNIETRVQIIEDTVLKSVTSDFEPSSGTTISGGELKLENFSSEFSQGATSFTTSEDYASGTLSVYCNGLNITLDSQETGANTFSIDSGYADIATEDSVLFVVFVGESESSGSGGGGGGSSEIQYSGSSNIILDAFDGSSITIDPGSDKVIVYDDSANNVKYVSISQITSSSESSTSVSYTGASNIILDAFDGSSTNLDPLSDKIIVYDSSSSNVKYVSVSKIANSSNSFETINVGGGYGDSGLTIDSTGNLSMDGTLSVSGTVNMSSDLNLSGNLNIGSLSIPSLSEGSILVSGTSGLISDNSNMTVNESGLSVSSAINVSGSSFLSAIYSSSLSQNGIVTVGSDGILESSTDVIFSDNLFLIGDNFSVSSTSGFLRGVDASFSGDLSVLGSLNVSNFSISSLRETEVLFAGSSGEISSTSSFTFGSNGLSLSSKINVLSSAFMSSVYSSDLNNGNIVVSGSQGLLTSPSSLSFNDDTFSVGSGFSVSATSGAIDASGGIFGGSIQVSGTLDASGLTLPSVSPGEVLVAGASGELFGTSNLSFNENGLEVGSTLTVSGSSFLSSLYSSSLSNNSIIVSGSQGILETTSALTFDGSSLSVGSEFSVSSTSGIISGSSGSFSGSIHITGTSSSSGVNSGSLVVDGGLGVSGSSHFGGTLNANNLTVEGDFSVSGTVSFSNMEISSITENRVLLGGASGQIVDTSDLTFESSTLGITGNISVSGTSSFSGDVTLGDSNSDTTTVNSKITSLIPSTSSETLGDSGNFWGSIFGDRLTISQGVSEAFSSLSSASGVVTHNCNDGQVFYHTSPSSNFTVNLTNLNLSPGNATNVSIIINQGSTARIPSALQISSSSQTILWQGGSTPSGTNNGTDVISFSILNNSGSYIVLGQLVGFE